MENLIFSLNASLPIFLVMACGYFFRQIGWMDEPFAAKMNTFVFKISLPAMLFKDLAVIDCREAWDTKFVLFCFGVTVVSIVISFVVASLWKDKSIKGEFIQASYRSSAAILGIAFIQNIYGTSGMGPLMIIGSVPLYNICAVAVLTVFKPQDENSGTEDAGKNADLFIKTIKGILTNPIILGIAVGFIWSFFRIPLPTVLDTSVGYLGRVATPMGLIAMGARFDFKKALGKVKPTIVASVIKLVGFCTLFLPVAILLGFRNEALVAILVMLGSSATVTCYVMARNMGHEGTLSSGVVMITTLFCSFTLAFWLFVLRSGGFI